MKKVLVFASLVAACGSSSTPGEIGPTGPTGANGATGALGASGVNGVNGATGATGSMGATGATGSMGAPGDSDAGVPGPTGATGPTGAMGSNGSNGSNGANGATGTTGATGTMGATGATGTMGATGATGAMGATGPTGSTVTVASLGSGNVSCPYGGVQITVGLMTATACNGAPGSGGSVTYSGGYPPVSFVGYTTATYGGNLNGRSGANALCDAVFSGSHFCVDWELDQANPPTPSSGSAWVDTGSSQVSSRFFRSGYSTSDLDTCSGWTSSVANQKPDGINTGTGQTFTALGGFASSFAGSNDGGCENTRPLACCKGGTGVRFRGFTPSTSGGNLGGRTGANATCAAAYAGSHFCVDWEVDQATVRSPIPSSSAWVDTGSSSTTSRIFRSGYSTSDLDTCSGWTSSVASQKPDGINTGTGQVLTPLGGFASSFAGSNDGGCENPRPLACCDGFPPQ
jgi:hypothetical protein